MEKLEIARTLGEKIIKDQHDYFASAKIEDLIHITNLKRIIVAIAEYLMSENVSEDKKDDLVEHLRRFGKTLYISICIENKDEAENEHIKKSSACYPDFAISHKHYTRRHCLLRCRWFFKIQAIFKKLAFTEFAIKSSGSIFRFATGLIRRPMRRPT